MLIHHSILALVSLPNRTARPLKLLLGLGSEFLRFCSLNVREFVGLLSKFAFCEGMTLSEPGLRNRWSSLRLFDLQS